MIDINANCAFKAKFLAGSSSLIFGTEQAAGNFLQELLSDAINKHNLRWLCPQTIMYKTLRTPNETEKCGYKESTKEFLENPREIFYQTIGRRICFGGELVFIKGITTELIDSFDNQNLDGWKNSQKQIIDEILAENSDQDIEYEEYEDEYPLFDEFGNVNQISWLREYAMYADEFGRRNKMDVFLNLDWDKTRKDLPSMFWGLFDRIYKVQETEVGTIKASQLK